ncbi:hypothetical protein NX059_001204 [Plenodomus lindquistii]|nr:hypothetical protein NX059_001204 [Plenodomus lindquistii]
MLKTKDAEIKAMEAAMAQLKMGPPEPEQTQPALAVQTKVQVAEVKSGIKALNLEGNGAKDEEMEEEGGEEEEGRRNKKRKRIPRGRERAIGEEGDLRATF